MLGGVCLNTGTIPSKTLREAVLYLTGLDQREMYGQSYRVKDEITIADLTASTQHVVGRESDVVRSQLTRNRVAILPAPAGSPARTRCEVDDGEPAAPGHRQGHRDRDRHQARPAGQRRLRREDDHRRGRDPAPASASPVDAGRGRRA